MEIKPVDGKEMHPRALSINGYNPDKWENWELGTTMEMFLDWIMKTDEQTLAGHNPSFDRDFCNHAFEETELPFLFNHRTVDLHSVAYAKFLGNGMKCTKLYSDRIYQLLQMPTEPKPHNALTGARMEAQALRLLIK